MNRAPEQTDRKTALMSGLASFLSKYRKVLAGLLIVIALVVVSLVVILTLQQNRRDESLEAVEELQRSYGQWLAASESERSEGGERLVEQASAVVTEYEGMYAAIRASLIQADVLFELERWDEAAAQFAETAAIADDSYLGAVASMGAAVSYENAGNGEQALAVYGNLVDAFAEDSSFMPRALFNIGRIHEQSGSIVEAADSYNRLIDDYPTSSWTNLARNRIITLTVEGRIGEE